MRVNRLLFNDAHYSEHEEKDLSTAGFTAWLYIQHMILISSSSLSVFQTTQLFGKWTAGRKTKQGC